MGSGPSKTESGSRLQFEAECKGCGLKFNVPIDRFKEEGYINWIKATLCLQYTKEGLESFVDTTFEEYYDSVQADILAASKCPDQCQLKDFSRNNFKCQYGLCDTLRKRLLQSSKHNRLEWNNTTLKDIASSSNELAKLFLPAMCKDYSGPIEGDTTAILTLVDECLHFSSKIDDADLVKKVRDSRNSIMHSGTMREDQQQLSQHVHNFVDLLSDSVELKKDQNCLKAVMNIQNVHQEKVRIDLVKAETEVLDKLDKQNNATIEQFRQMIESPQCTPDSLHLVKSQIKENEEKEAKLAVLMECYDVDSSSTTKRKTQLSLLHEQAEKQMREKNDNQMKAKEDQIEELREKATALQKDLEKAKKKEDEPSDQTLDLNGKKLSVKDMHEAVLLNKPILQKLKLIDFDMLSLEDQLPDICNIKQLVSLELIDLKLSHEQWENLCLDFSRTDQLREVSLAGLSCSTHVKSGECSVTLDLTRHTNLTKVGLALLPCANVAFDAKHLLECDIALPNNVSAQTSSLSCLGKATNLQVLTCRYMSDPASVIELVTILPQLDSLQKIELYRVDFGSFREIRLSTAMEKLESVGLLSCTKITGDGFRCLVKSLPKHRVVVRLGSLFSATGSVIIKCTENVLQEIRDSQKADVRGDRNVQYRKSLLNVGWFEFYNNN